jgi:hypothetical protein
MDLTGIGPLAELAQSIINRLWPDASEEEKAKLTLALAELNTALALAQGQAAVNAVEAANPSLWVSGWRPGVGWICVVALGYQYVVYPLLLWLVAFYPALHAPPPVVSEILLELMFGMLGVAGLRSYEKTKGIA